jgi:peptidoglycan L-alanyl-D-glutamate endopeptidase CwlK
MASNKIEDAHPTLRHAYELAKAEWTDKHPNGPAVIITQSLRTVAEQNKLYAQGRTTKGPIVTRARGLQSAHNYFPSYAIDVSFKKADGTLDWSEHWYKEFAPLMTKHEDVEWGGSWPTFKDLPHFQVRNWKSQIKK